MELPVLPMLAKSIKGFDQPPTMTCRALSRTGRELRPMRTMSYTESRARYAETLDAVVNDREEVIITRAGHEPVVIVALAEYESLRESAYLLRNPENARRLLAAIDRLESGRGTEAHRPADR